MSHKHTFRSRRTVPVSSFPSTTNNASTSLRLPDILAPHPPNTSTTTTNALIDELHHKTSLFDSCMKVSEALAKLRCGPYAVTVSVRGKIEWSAHSDDHPPPPSMSGIDHDEDHQEDGGGAMMMNASDIQSLFPPVDTLRERIESSFRNTAKTFRSEIESLRKQLEVTRAELKAKTETGSAYMDLLQQRDQVLKEKKEALVRIRHLSRLLERCSTQLHEQATQHEEAMDDMRRVLLQKQNTMDWSEARRTIEDLNLEGKDDPTVLRDILGRLDSMHNKVQAHEDKIEVLQEMMLEKDQVVAQAYAKCKKAEDDHARTREKMSSAEVELTRIHRELSKATSLKDTLQQQLNDILGPEAANKAGNSVFMETALFPFSITVNGAVREVRLRNDEVEEVVYAAWRKEAPANELAQTLRDACREWCLTVKGAYNDEELYVSVLSHINVRLRHNILCMVLHAVIKNEIPPELLEYALKSYVIKLYGRLLRHATPEGNVTASVLRDAIKTFYKSWDRREVRTLLTVAGVDDTKENNNSSNDNKKQATFVMEGGTEQQHDLTAVSSITSPVSNLRTAASDTQSGIQEVKSVTIINNNDEVDSSPSTPEDTALLPTPSAQQQQQQNEIVINLQHFFASSYNATQSDMVQMVLTSTFVQRVLKIFLRRYAIHMGSIVKSIALSTDPNYSRPGFATKASMLQALQTHLTGANLDATVETMEDWIVRLHHRANSVGGGGSGSGTTYYPVPIEMAIVAAKRTLWTNERVGGES